MSLRNVTLTAVAALSFGMAAHAQTTTITVPMGEPGAAAPAPTGPGTTVTLQDGRQSVVTSAATEPAATTAAPTASTTPANPAAMADAETSATAAEPAKGASPAEAAATAETGTAATAMNPTTPTPTPSPGEPPAAPKEGLPESAGAAQVNAPVPTATEAAPEAAPAEPAAAPTEPAATATESPAEAPEGEAPRQPADTTPAAAPAPEAADVPANAENPAEVHTKPAATDAGAATEAAPAAESEATAAHVPHQEIHDVAFSFEGPFGKYDQFQLQRGLQVYTEVCSGCHGMKQVPLRTLHDAGGPGLPEDQMRAYAKALTVMDPATGEERPREPTDFFPTVTGEGMGPDLSLMAKARAGFHGPYGTGLSQLFNGIGGPEYIYSILTGYTGETKEQAGATFYENKAFPGGWISMPPPLSDDQVTFEDGSPSDLHSEAKDIAAFLMWAAEPKMMARKQSGLVAVLFLIVLSSLLYLTNKRLWWPIKHRQDMVGDGR